MLPSWRNRIYLAICPDRISLCKYGRGWKPKLLAAHEEGLGSSSNPQSILARLGQLLGQTEWRDADVHVVLSNRMIRYAVLPSDPQLRGHEEREAFARHALSQVYGALAERWELRIQATGKANAHYLVCATDKSLLEGLGNICAAGKLKLRSVTPYLMQVFNRHLNTLKSEPTWLVVSERGYSLLALLRDGEIVTVNGVRHDNIDELGMLLERENLLGAVDEPCKSVHLHAPLWDRLPSNTFGYQFSRLGTETPGESASPEANLHAMALSGVL